VSFRSAAAWQNKRIIQVSAAGPGSPAGKHQEETGRYATNDDISGSYDYNGTRSWGFGEDLGQKKVDQLFGKPFLIYEVSEKWNLVYIPLGMSHSFNAPRGAKWTVPIGGGVRRLFEIHGQKMGLQFQAFDYVARKSKDPEWELRATIEFLFD
jgi:hypothetical protein